jgi:GNAT superfamily N-acetyltransferase
MSAADIRVTTDQEQLDVQLIHRFLSEESYWAKGVPLSVTRRAIESSLCFGLFQSGAQVGFARVITDYATFGYLCDVFVLESHRGKGLSRILMEHVMAHPGLATLRRMVLVTGDAHFLYEKVGFRRLAKPERYMELHRPDVYQNWHE